MSLRVSAARTGLAVALGLAGIALSAPPSQAGTCSSQTGGSNNQLMWTGNASSPYTCAYTATTGNKKIGAWNTQSWTSSTALGYQKKYNCQKQSGGVTVSYIYAGTSAGSSITYTAFNGEDGSRHWTGAVLWATGGVNTNQYNHSCSDYTINSNLVYLSKSSISGPSSIATGTQATYTVTVSNPDGGVAPAGTVALFRQVGASQSPQGKNCDGSANSGTDPAIASGTISNGVATIKTPATLPAGSYSLYAAYAGTPVSSSGLPSFCMTPPQNGLTGSATKTVTLTVGSGIAVAAPSRDGSRVNGDLSAAGKSPRLAVLDASTRAPKPLTIRCNPGQAPVQAQVGSDDAVIKPQWAGKVKRGVKVATESLPKGTTVDAQVVCRPVLAKAIKIGRVAFGSIKADTLRMDSKGLILGGLGDDNLTVNEGSAFGGPGADRIRITSRGAAAGGPGADRLVAEGTGLMLLNGDIGHDRFSSSPKGTTLINALDGHPGDVVRCNSARTYVKADKGDTLKGSCKSPSARK